MTTLQRERTRETGTQHERDPVSGPVPTPFPVNVERPVISRSPSATRAKIGGMFDKVKRAISSSRERSGSEDGGRGRSGDRRQSAAGIREEDDETRGRPGASAVHFTAPLKATETGTTFGALSKSTSRSASRGRLTTGRGGAGNMVGAVSEDAGEESEETLQQARENRSRSRGREEVFVGGRGGRGNIRGDSADGVKAEAREQELADELKLQEQLLAKKSATQQVFTSGRGGAGNMRFTSPSRANGSVV